MSGSRQSSTWPTWRPAQRDPGSSHGGVVGAPDGSDLSFKDPDGIAPERVALLALGTT